MNNLYQDRAERQKYRDTVLAYLANTANEPLTNLAALAVDVLTVTPQALVRDPFGVHAFDHFAVHAEYAGERAPSRAALRDALTELAARKLLPSWVYVPALAAVERSHEEAETPAHFAQTVVEFERNEWRRHAAQKIAHSEAVVSAELAGLLDALAATPQAIAANPLSGYCIDYLNAHAAAFMVRSFELPRLRELLDDLARLDLLPPWCSWPPVTATAEGVAL